MKSLVSPYRRLPGEHNTGNHGQFTTSCDMYLSDVKNQWFLFLKKWPPWGTERRSEQLPSSHAWLFVFQWQTTALQAMALWSLVQWMQPCALQHIYHCAAIMYRFLLEREVEDFQYAITPCSPAMLSNVCV